MTRSPSTDGYDSCIDAIAKELVSAGHISQAMSESYEANLKQSFRPLVEKIFTSKMPINVKKKPMTSNHDSEPHDLSKLSEGQSLSVQSLRRMPQSHSFDSFERWTTKPNSKTSNKSTKSLLAKRDKIRLRECFSSPLDTTDTSTSTSPTNQSK